MRNASHDAYHDLIDTKMFFELLARKLDREQFDLVTAAMAESVSRGGVSRVLDCAASPRTRIAALRKRLRDKFTSVTRD